VSLVWDWEVYLGIVRVTRISGGDRELGCEGLEYNTNSKARVMATVRSSSNMRSSSNLGSKVRGVTLGSEAVTAASRRWQQRPGC
jgi:hypothetical protein